METIKPSDTPRTDAAFRAARYKVDDELHGKRIEYDIGKLKQSMVELERSLAAAQARVGRLEQAIKYALEDGPNLIPRATSECRKVLRKALAPQEGER